MAKINGTDLTIYIPTAGVDSDSSTTTWEPIAYAKTASLNLAQDTPDVSNKDSAGWAESISGQLSWSMDFDGLVDYSILDASGTSVNYDGLFDYLVARTKIKVAFGKDDVFWYGDGFISSLDKSAENESPTSFSGSITGTGSLTKGTDADIDVADAYPNA